MADIPALLLIGYGNPGRGDDGLGPAFAEMIAGENLAGVTCLADYQLSVDHVPAVAEVDCVVFADAMAGAEQPFVFKAVAAGTDENLASHDLTPAAVLGLATVLYGRTPHAYVLGISGEEFDEVKEGISAAASDNLGEAVAYFISWRRRNGV